MGRWVRACGLALLALGLFAPSARAGHCGWYVKGGEPFRQELARLLEGDGAVRRTTSPLPARPRCNGPSCSGQPAAPMAPAVAPPIPSDDWACTIAPVALGPDGIALHIPDEAGARPVRRGPAIFHPPRPTSA